MRASQAAICTVEEAIRDFQERVRTGYTSQVPAHVLRYCDRVNTVFTDMQSDGEHLGGNRAHMGDGGHSLHIHEADSDEERAAPPRVLNIIMLLLRFLPR